MLPKDGGIVVSGGELIIDFIDNYSIIYHSFRINGGYI